MVYMAQPQTLSAMLFWWCPDFPPGVLLLPAGVYLGGGGSIPKDALNTNQSSYSLYEDWF